MLLNVERRITQSEASQEYLMKGEIRMCSFDGPPVTISPETFKEHGEEIYRDKLEE